MSDRDSAKKEEVLVMTGVRARMAAYQQEIQRKDKVQKKYAPIFKVADDLGASFHSSDGMPVRDKKPVDMEGEMSMSANMDGTDNDENTNGGGAGSGSDADHVFQRSMNASGRLDFAAAAGNNSMNYMAAEDDLPEEEPEKPQEVKDDEEKKAKENLGRLLGPDPESSEKGDEEPVVLQAFTSVQRRYLKAVSKLRPQPFEFKKPDVKEAMPEAKAEIKKTLGREMDKSRHLTELTTTWDDYYEKAQDKPTEEVELQRVEEEVKQVEEEINNEWSNYAEKVVEVVVELQEEGDGDDTSVMTEDSDMVQWREEARRLKAEADQRKKQKADREERKKKRKQIAEIRKKRAAAAAARKKAQAAEAAKQQAEEEEEAKKKAEEEQARKKAEEEAARLRAEEEAQEARAARAAEEDAKKNDSPDGSDSSESSESVDSEAEKKASSGGAKEKHMVEKAKSPEPPSQKKKPIDKSSGGGGGAGADSDSDSSNENTKKIKKAKKKKDNHKEKPPKEKDSKKKKAKKAAAKKKGGGDDDSDMEDGVPEEYPRNLDGSLWKNPLKFWTNKPRKLNEVAPKVIMRPNPNSDVFCKSEDAINDNACFYWHKFEGDFNVLVKIKGDLKTSYDKAGIMIRQDERNWMMSGLEFFNKRINHSSCITRGISDWSLAPLPDEAKDGIWVAIKRHDNKVECFYSFDLKEWIQTRQGLFPTDKVVKVGIVAACPMGEPFKVVFERFRIQMVG